MMQLWKSAGRLAAIMLVAGVSSAFGAMYTFDLTNPTRLTSTTGGGIVISSNEDTSVTIQLTALAGPNTGAIVVLTPTGAGVADGNDDINGGAQAEALVITPLVGTSPFTVVSATFMGTETTGGGDEALVYLDNTMGGTPTFDIAIGTGSGVFTWTPASNNTFNTNITFRNKDGNDDFRVSEIVLDIDGVAPVPEPTTWTLFGMGIAGLAWLRRRKQA